MAQGTTKGVPIDIDPLLAADSDLLVPSQKAIKTYVDTGLLTKQAVLTNPVTGTGTNNEIAYFNTTGSTIASLPTATYPSLTELSYVKGVTSAIQTQISSKLTNNAWVDYSATSTITGFTNYANKKLQYKILSSDTMLVQFQIESTANNGSGTTTSFTLPSNASAWGTQYFMCQVQNGTTQTAAVAYINASSNVVTFSTSASTTNINAWTNAATRYIRGQFTINT